jgi:aryl-alcohol dehydrogenase-like predicted oxidoreductase
LVWRRRLRGRDASVTSSRGALQPLACAVHTIATIGRRGREVEDALRRLGTDWIDMYQVHRPRTDTEETLGALSDVVHRGDNFFRQPGAGAYGATAVAPPSRDVLDRERPVVISSVGQTE